MLARMWRHGVSHTLLVEWKNGKLLRMASLTQWTWVWANSRRWWRTGKTGVLQSTGSKESDTTERLNNNALQNRLAVPKNQACNYHTIQRLLSWVSISVIWKLFRPKNLCANVYSSFIYNSSKNWGVGEDVSQWVSEWLNKPQYIHTIQLINLHDFPKNYGQWGKKNPKGYVLDSFICISFLKLHNLLKW